MASGSALILSTFFIGALIIPETEAGIISSVASAIWAVIEYAITSVENVIIEIICPPRNRNSSIVYSLYTPESPQKPCFLEETDEALERCPFNTTYPLKFLIHGFLVDDPPLFQTKQKMLELYNYNVVLMDWTKYNQQPYTLASINTLLIGHRLANLIKFLEKAKGLDPQNVHLIGHSLGAHVSGAAGKDTPNLGRITGLDPAIPLFSPKTWLHRLTYKDAHFVDVIHTSTAALGLGIEDPIGHQDFYPNGGGLQPQCVANEDSLDYDEKDIEADVNLDSDILKGSISIQVSVCDHSSATEYFLESVDETECVFWSVMCHNYEDFLTGVCSNNSNTLATMGLPAHPINGLTPKAEFFLRTGEKEPYCLEDGYKPEKV